MLLLRKHKGAPGAESVNTLPSLARTSLKPYIKAISPSTTKSDDPGVYTIWAADRHGNGLSIDDYDRYLEETFQFVHSKIGSTECEKIDRVYRSLTPKAKAAL